MVINLRIIAFFLLFCVFFLLSKVKKKRQADIGCPFLYTESSIEINFL